MKKCLYLLVSALCFLLLFCPSSKATTYDTLISQLNKLVDKNVINESVPRNLTNHLNSNDIDALNNYGKYCILINNNNQIFIIILSQTSYIRNANNNNNTDYWEVVPAYYYSCRRANKDNATTWTGVSFGGVKMNTNTWTYGYTTFNITTRSLTLYAGEEYGGNYITGPSLVFTPATTKTINITANNVTESFYNLQNSRNINYWRLGSIQGALDVSAVELNLRCVC